MIQISEDTISCARKMSTHDQWGKKLTTNERAVLPIIKGRLLQYEALCALVEKRGGDDACDARVVKMRNELRTYIEALFPI